MSETREEELARLIEEQRRDDRDFQPPEPGVIPLGLLRGVVTAVDAPISRRDKLNAGCVVHGRENLRPDPTRGTGFACRICENARKKMPAARERAATRRRQLRAERRRS